MMDKFNDVADDWMFKLDELVDGPMFQMQSYTTRATVSAICKVGSYNSRYNAHLKPKLDEP